MRSRRAELLVLIGICTHLGCLPKQFFDPGDPVLGAELAGRVPLSLPWLALRPGRTRVQRLTGADQSECAAVQLPDPHTLVVGLDNPSRSGSGLMADTTAA